MADTRRLSIELPVHWIAWIEAQVRSGRFVSESDAIACAIRALDDQDETKDDPDIDAWLRGEVVPAYRAWEASGENALTPDEFGAALANRSVRPHHRDAAE